MKIKILTIFLLFVGWTFSGWAAEDEMTFPAGTLIMEKPDLNEKPVGVMTGSETLSVIETQPIVFQTFVVSSEIIFYKVKYNGQIFWAAPEWQMTEKGPKITDPQKGVHLTISVILLLLGALLTAAFFRRNPDGEQGWIKRPALLIFALILWHYAWLKIFFSMYPGVAQSMTDEGEYFRIAGCFLRGDFHEAFHYTIGYPLCCTPFLALIGVDHLPAVSFVISYFSALAMTPLTLILAFLLLRKIGGSDWKAFLALALWQWLPRIFIMAELPFQGSTFSPLGIHHSDYIFQAYQLCLTGFNSLSEWASVNLVLGASVLAAYWRGGGRKYLTVGLLFGFAMLVRMNNLLLAPLLAYWFWLTDRDRLAADRKYLLKMAALAIGGAGVVFVWQLVVNAVQLGSPFRTPYALHQEYGQGKVGLQYFAGMLVYYFRTQGFYLVPGVLGMLLTVDRRTRNLLIWWTIPTILFFCCFNFQGFHYRFLLAVYPGILAGLVCSSVWTEGKKRHRVILAAVMLFWVIPILPVDLNWQHLASRVGQPSPWLKIMLTGPVLAAAFWCLRKDWRKMLFLALFLVMLYDGMQWLLAAALLAALGWALWDWGREAAQAFRAPGGSVE